MRPALLALVGLLALAPAAAARPSTPELIERAQESGQVDRSRANLLRTYALAAPARLPAAYRSQAPWDGTLELLRVRRELPRVGPAAREEITELLAAPAGGESCDSEGRSQAGVLDTTHFHITYATVGAGLTAGAYGASLERSWNTEVDAFGWAAPPVFGANPPPGGRYHVRIDPLQNGLYGFVSPVGDHAGLVGNNPATSWNEGDAYASCMVLNADYSGFDPSSPQAALDSTTAHEFNHSIQFGLGVLTGANAADDSFVEGGATWMEDEVHDAADDNHLYLWPDFTQSMGEYAASPYPYWITFRGLSERFGTGVAGGGEQVMQDFWELTSRNLSFGQAALGDALALRGTTLASAFHSYAIAVKFNRACGGGYSLPHCFEEGPAYVSRAGVPPVHRTVPSAGASVTGSVRDDHAIAWVALPAGPGGYHVTLANTSGGGLLRGTVACDTGAGLALFPLAAPLAAGGQATLPGFEPFGCQAPVLVITNEARTNGDPTSSAQRSFAVSTAPAPTALRALGVTLAGGGSGTVASSPSGISCGADCSESYAHGTQVTLTATPAAGSSFAGFGGDCAGTGPCTLSMTSARAVTATFEPLPGTVTPVVTTAGPTPARLDTVAPALTRLRLLPSRFRAARSGPALAALAGARLGLTLGEPATVTFRVARVTASGRLVRLRGLARRALPAGRSTLRYRGRLAGRTLRPGAYRLLVRARDAAGNVSPQRRAAFRIVPGSSRTPRAAER